MTEPDKIRLLMVDDDGEDVDLVRDMVQDRGASRIEVTWAPTYEQGMAVLGQEGFDACLVDYRMGARDGIEFLREAAAVAPDTPLILLTGMGGADVDRRAMAAGASDYIPKGELTGAKLERSIRYAAERKRRSQAESRFRALIENSHDLIAILGRDGTLDYISPSIQWMLGLEAAEMTGRSLMPEIHPDDRGRVDNALARVIAEDEDSSRLRYRVRHADGGWRTLETVAANHLHDPAIGGVVLNSRDITERVEREARLRFQASLLDAVDQAVIATDPKGVVTYWNRTAEAIYGWTADEALGESILDLTTPDTGRPQAAEVMEALRRGEVWTGEFTVRRKDGSSFPALVSNSPIRDAEGRLVAIIGVSSDVSALKEAEADLRERVKELRTLYRVTRTLANQEAPLDERLQEVLKLIPSGWLHPEITEARLVLGDTEMETEGFRESPWMHAVSVGADGIRGRLEVALTEERPERDEGPFLAEERELLETLASIIGEALERQRLSHLHERSVASLGEAVIVGEPVPEGVRIRSVNPAAVRVFGYEVEEMEGRLVEMLHVDPETAAGFREELFPTLRSAGAFHSATVMRRKDGKVFQAEQTVTLLEPQQGLDGGLVVVVRDVSERARAEAGIRESEERFRQIAEHIQDVFWIRSGGGARLEYVSPAFDEVWGRPVNEVYEDPTRWEETVLPSDRKRVEALRRESARDGYEEEYRIVRPDGEIRWIWERAFPVIDEGGDLVRLVGVSEDVTERRRLEERFQVLSRQISDVLYVVGPDGTVLFSTPSIAATGYGRQEFEGMIAFDLVHPDDRQRVRERFDEIIAHPGETDRLEYRIVLKDGTVRHVESVGRNLLDEPSIAGVVISTRDITERIELEEQLRQSQKMEAIGRLAGGIAHDFNNLLTVIRSQADLLLMDLEPSGAVAAEVEAIQQAADRAARLTSQLLAFSRYQVLRPQVVDLSGVVGGLSQLLDRLIGEDVQVVYELPEGLPAVEIDPGQIEQVVLNLAINARDAMPDGGVLRLSTRRERGAPDAGDESHEGSAEFVVLQVEDTGSGMDVATRERIFEPFFTTKPAGRGTGLGLAMVYGVVQQSGGSVDVTSEPGSGTTFRLRFPAAEGPAEALPVPDRRREAPGTVSGRILVVEDNDDVRRAVRRILERAGLEVESVDDAEKGLAVLKEGSPVALLLTDLVLPRMSGRRLVDIARQTMPDLPIMVMSGYHGGEPGELGDLPRDVAFVQKPFTPDELLGLVREILADS